MSKRITKFDRIIGRRLKEARLDSNASQVDLAKHLGVSFQQIQKYEMGTNRISAGKLAEAAEFLGIRAATLLEGL